MSTDKEKPAQFEGHRTTLRRFTTALPAADETLVQRSIASVIASWSPPQNETTVTAVLKEQPTRAIVKFVANYVRHTSEVYSTFLDSARGRKGMESVDRTDMRYKNFRNACNAAIKETYPDLPSLVDAMKGQVK